MHLNVYHLLQNVRVLQHLRHLHAMKSDNIYGRCMRYILVKNPSENLQLLGALLGNP